MPTASVARLEKQASLDANDPLRQAIVMIDHKIRNLEKRKGRLDSYKDLQKNGKDLNGDQLEAISKYDAVVAHLDFSKELSKLLTNLAVDSAKNIKKQARKEALERAQQEVARTKDILIIQDVLASMGQDSVRDDFLSGKGKITLTAEELQAIDELYVELTPKRDEPVVFTEMFQNVAETMVTLIDGKNKEAFGTTYSALKTKILDIASSGYFDTASATTAISVPEPVPIPVQVDHQEPSIENEESAPATIDVTENEVTTVPQENIAQPPQTPCTFQPTGQNMEETAPAPIETAYFTPSHLRVFKSGTIDFMQENELDLPDSNEPPSIPTMTYTNQSFSPLEVTSQQVATTTSQPPSSVTTAAPVAATLHYQNQTDEEKGWSSNTNTMVVEPQTNVIVTTVIPKQPTNAVPQTDDSSGWEEEPPAPQTISHEDDWASQTENWSDNIYKPQNDGFITAGGGRGRGGRGRGGGDRNKGGYGGSRGGNRGSSRGGYNRGEGFTNREGGGNYREGGYRETGGGNNYYKDQGNYQNGYQNRNDQQRGGGRGGSNRGSSDRTGNRGGRGGRGSYRGGNNPGSGGGYRQ